MSILGPAFLVNSISLIALLTGVVLLMIFSDFVNRRMVFPLADMVKERTHRGMKPTHESKWGFLFSKYFSEGLAAVIFIVYCYFGSSLLAEYIFGPIFSSLREYLLLVVLGLFFTLSYIINSAKLRRKFLKV